MKYCKKLFALLAAALLCMALTLPAGAAAPLVRDECGVFDADTLADLEEQAESASDGHDVDVYFLVVDDIGDADQRDYAKNYYISNGLGYGDEQSGILFLLAIFFSPVAAMVPAYAAAGALIYVGVLMCSELTRVKWQDLTEAVPAFMTAVMMPYSFSITEGIAVGFISYCVMKAGTGRWREINPCVLVVALLFVLKFVWVVAH